MLDLTQLSTVRHQPRILDTRVPFGPVSLRQRTSLIGYPKERACCAYKSQTNMRKPGAKPGISAAGPHDVAPPPGRRRVEISVTHEVTRLLDEWGKGNERAAADLMPLVYRELRQLAAAYLRSERHGHTLQPTALVHEAYLRLVDRASPDWQSRSHFYGIAARVMRQILVDHARRKQAKKRTAQVLPLEQAASFQPDRSGDLVALDESLTDLESIDARKCQAIELRYFAGLTMDEIAQAMSVSIETVRREMRMAEAWLHDAMRSV
jgi:RNA polymerase sigma factor (TIGR02999 family)